MPAAVPICSARSSVVAMGRPMRKSVKVKEAPKLLVSHPGKPKRVAYQPAGALLILCGPVGERHRPASSLAAEPLGTEGRGYSMPTVGSELEQLSASRPARGCKCGPDLRIIMGSTGLFAPC